MRTENRSVQLIGTGQLVMTTSMDEYWPRTGPLGSLGDLATCDTPFDGPERAAFRESSHRPSGLRDLSVVTTAITPKDLFMLP